MRKWMSERFKRRKRSAESSASEASPASAPLQPKYFEAETQAPAEAVPEREPIAVASKTRQHEEPQPSSLPAEPQPGNSPAVNRPAGPVRRRRRGRGGRGRQPSERP